jgi:hypothetical protein
MVLSRQQFRSEGVCVGGCAKRGMKGKQNEIVTNALFSLRQSSKFFHSLSITSIFNRLHGVLNVGKKITNYTV